DRGAGARDGNAEGRGAAAVAARQARGGRGRAAGDSAQERGRGFGGRRRGAALRRRTPGTGGAAVAGANGQGYPGSRHLRSAASSLVLPGPAKKNNFFFAGASRHRSSGRWGQLPVRSPASPRVG